MPEAWAALGARLGSALGFALLARLRPGWIVPALLALVPLQVRVFPEVALATLALVAAAAARAPAIARAARAHPAATAALATLPLWVATSALWARQPAFVPGAVGRWATVALAAMLAAADDEPDPRPLVAGALAAVLPCSLWALGERLHWIAPRGERSALEVALIRVGDLVRGRALFHHPNKLAEFLEGTGLLLAAGALARSGWPGALRLAAALGLAAALAGAWATGSAAGLGLLAALAVALAGARLAGRVPPGRRAAWTGAAVLAGAGLAALAYVGHGGLGSRRVVYEFAAGVIAERPWLGLGGGNWPLAVGSAPPSISRFWFRSHPHSLYLMVWAELGAVGVLALLAFFLVPLAAASRGLARAPLRWRPVGVGAIAGVAALLLHGLFNYFLRYPVNGIAPGLLLGLALGASGRRGE